MVGWADPWRRPHLPSVPSARSRGFLLGHLREHDLAVGLAGGHQLLVAADAGHGAALQDDDPVGVQDGAHALGHDDDGGVVQLLPERGPQASVGTEVQG